jgi:hypothetical protein
MDDPRRAIADLFRRANLFHDISRVSRSCTCAGRQPDRRDARRILRISGNVGWQPRTQLLSRRRIRLQCILHGSRPASRYKRRRLHRNACPPVRIGCSVIWEGKLPAYLIASKIRKPSPCPGVPKAQSCSCVWSLLGGIIRRTYRGSQTVWRSERQHGLVVTNWVMRVVRR